MSKKIEVVIVMGSESDYKIMKEAMLFLKKWKVSVNAEVVSAHRTPHLLAKKVKEWEHNGVQVIIAGAGGAAHLPGMIASFSVLPVIGVPVATKKFDGLDSLLSIVQMPKGVPVATVAVDNAENAAILCAEILALKNKTINAKLKQHKKTLIQKVSKMQKNIKKKSRS